MATYNNHYWPAKYFIDKDGNIRYTHFGEGGYDESEKWIQELLKETGSVDVSGIIKNDPAVQNFARTPESYLGYARLDRFSSPENISENKSLSILCLQFFLQIHSHMTGNGLS